MNNIIKPKTVDFENVPTTHVTKTGKKTPDFYKGTSFRWCREWEPGRSYVNDDYHVDLVYHKGKSWICTESHISNAENAPSEDVSVWELAVNQSGSGIHVGPEAPTEEEYGDLATKMLWLDTDEEENPIKVYSTAEVDAKLTKLSDECKKQYTTVSEKKADKATTLSGYGIKDAYTKTQVDTAVADAKKAGTDANAALETYKTSNDIAVSKKIENSGDGDNILISHKDYSGINVNSDGVSIFGATGEAYTEIRAGDIEIHMTAQEFFDESSTLSIKPDGAHLSINGKSSKLATESYVKSAIAGGIRFAGIVKELPWVVAEMFPDLGDTEEEILGKWKPGDLIIVTSGYDSTEGTKDPSQEYILVEHPEDGRTLYIWELLGETTAVDKRITEEIARAKAAEAKLNTDITNETKRAKSEEGKLLEVVATKADKEGTYPGMTVGKAENLVGRGEATEEYINFRQSAGNVSIEDGSAKIPKIKGNSLVYNQQINNELSTTTNGYWNARQGSNFATLENGVIELSRNPNTQLFSNQIAQNVSVQPNDKFYCCFNFESHNVNQDGLRVQAGFSSSWSNRQVFNDTLRGKGLGVSGFVEDIDYIRPNYTDISNVCIWFTDPTLELSQVNDTPLKIWGFKFINLTKMFGVGNEPTTVEEYHQRKVIGVDTTVRNTGEIISNNVTAIKSVGENAYDYRKDSEPFRVLAKTYNFEGRFDDLAFGPTKDEMYNILGEHRNGFNQEGYLSVYGGNESTCINLKHSYDKPFMHQYQESEIRFDFIKTIKDWEGNLLFPNGLCSAGSAYDEIRYNATTKKWEAVKRVGVRAYVEGDAENSAVLTDGVNTNYELEDYEVEELDVDFNPTYLVWDFGTEEAIASVPSAPFRADIVYQFNAVDRIRNNSDRIAELDEQIKENSNSITSKQDTLTLSIKNNGNIVIGNLVIGDLPGQSKEFMPATLSGDPMHDAYVAEGAVYDTSKNCWLLNGLELTNADMRGVYAGTKDFTKHMISADSRLPFVASDLYRLGQFKTNLAGGSESLMYSIIPSWKNMFRNNLKLETINPICGSDGVYLLRVADLNTAFAGCEQFKNILYPINISRIDTDDKMTTAFSMCFKLEDVKLKGLKVSVSFKDSPNLSKDSLLYMIDNCVDCYGKEHLDITITLHPKVYAKCVVGGEWQNEITEKISEAELDRNVGILLAE